MLSVARAVGILSLVAYGLACAAVFVMMRQPPAVVGPFLDRVPGIAWAALPMETLWSWANRGDLNPGEEAPDFDLPTLDGKSRVRLSALRGRPVVLVFGSYTCPPFRERMPDMNRLYEPFRDRAAFYFIYVEEAHATDSWPAETNAREGVLYARHRRHEDRVSVGEVCASRLRIPFPMLVDEMDDRVERTYRAWPIRVYVIDKDGRIAYKTRPGPFGFEADLVRPALEGLLGPASAPAT